MDYGTMALWILSVGVVGGYFTYKYGQRSYEDGIIDACDLHSTGELTYTVEEYDDGAKTIDIRIKRQDEE